MIGPAIGLLLLAFANCDHVLPVIYLCIACGTNGALYSGYQVRIEKSTNGSSEFVVWIEIVQII